VKIKIVKSSYPEVLKYSEKRRQKPLRPMMFFRILMKVLSVFGLLKTKFQYREIGMEKLGPKEPCVILMNHSSFTDLKLASTIWFPRPLNIVATQDAYVGKGWLMRLIGCIPTKKFVTDTSLVRDMVYALKELKTSVLLFPEAGYSFDGTATTLPDSLGKCLKIMGAPLVMITTYGAFARDPLYNNLQIRNVKVSADVKYVLSPQELKEMSTDEINAVIKECFSFDNLRWQQENKVRIAEKFRADGLNRVLYKCPHCLEEGKMLGKGTKLVCEACGKAYELTEYGFLEAIDGESAFTHIPDWYRWERECVRKELENGTYHFDRPVEIYMMVNKKALYHVGKGDLKHTMEGFRLTGCDGALDFTQKANATYSLNSDYFWYELGDVICIGDGKALYYCFPQDCKDVVTKARLAAEEIYKMVMANKGKKAQK
jgi:1-acyl-sn-glycerol-3-phosphate acyltransferase